MRLAPLGALVFALLAACLARPALASGDFSCAPRWTLIQRDPSKCNNLPFLSPGNDSRVNLQLLLLDAGKAILSTPGAPPAKPAMEGAAPFSLDQLDALLAPPKPGTDDDDSDTVEGQGSRCGSDPGGTADFEAALAATATLPSEERDALVAARRALRPTCDDGKPAEFQPPAPASAPGRQFAGYLAGAAAFYRGDWGAATRLFAGLRDSPQPWLAEAARYMAGRVALNQAAAAAFDAYGLLDRQKVDGTALDAADAGFRDYLKTYPTGQYADSARGLLRRVAWLGNRRQRLAEAFTAEFDRADPAADPAGEIALVQEADQKLMMEARPPDVQAPLLLAALDLKEMRGEQLDAAGLAAQEPAFAGRKELYGYLLAARAFYVAHDAAKVLALLPDRPPPTPMGFLEYSRQVLRNLALDARGERMEARLHWLSLIAAARPPLQRAVLDIALAGNEERDNALDQVYADGSPVQDRAVREVLLRYAAGPALLAARARSPTAPGRERRVARYVLLYKDLMRGRYAALAPDGAIAVQGTADPDDANRIVGAEPDASIFRWAGAKESDDGYSCPPLADIAAALVKAPHLPRGLICLAEFRRLNGLDYAPLDATPPPDELGGTPSGFDGAVFSRMGAYQDVLAGPKSTAGEKAYALYRAINCYAPAGETDCGNPDVPREQRKQWFRTLKTTYAHSRWARALQFYW